MHPRPTRVLVVKCGYDGQTRRITFPSAVTCRLDALKTRVEECFSLSASPFHLSYTDDDGEDFTIRSEHDLTDAITYFLSADDGSSYSANNASWSSQIPSSTQKIQVRLEVILEYEGPSLSDTSSILSRSDGETDGWTESLRSVTLGLTEYESTNGSISRPPSLHASSHYTHSGPPPPLTGPDSESAPSLLTHSELGSRWLRDQTTLTSRRQGPASRTGSVPRRTHNDSDDESLGDLELIRDARGKYYYSYQADIPSTSGESGDLPLRPVSLSPFLYTGPPILAPDCSGCGVRLDYIRYVCLECGEGELWRDSTDKPVNMTRSHSYSSVSTDRPGDVAKRAKARTSSISTRASTSSDEQGRVVSPGFELCPSCIETHGISHAKVARTSLQRSQHTFREKLWSSEGWADIVYAEESSCTICRNLLIVDRYKCISCRKFDLCRFCYQKVEEIHPAHAFLSLPDYDSPEDGTSLSGGSQPPQKAIRHPGAFCHSCLQDIVGPRFHCAICPSWDLCSRCEGIAAADNGFGHTPDHIMMKIPIPLPSAEVEAVSQLARDRWTLQDSAISLETHSRSSSPTNETVYAPVRVDRNHGCRCNGCNEWITGKRYQCANCPSDPTAYNLCSTCEIRSYQLHDPFHTFFKLDRPVHSPLRSPVPLLPILHRNPVGRTAAQPNSDPTAYLRAVLHRETLCDVHGDQIRGVWLRCVHCPAGFDICKEAEQIASHDATHVFVVFKAKVDMAIFRALADLDSTQSRPLLNRQVYS